MLAHIRRGVPAALALAALGLPASTSTASSLSVTQTIAPTLSALHTVLADAPAGDPAVALVGLRLRDKAGLQRFIAHASDPSDPAYGRYLSPAQFRARYSPSQADVDAVTHWLTSAGLQVIQSPSNHLYVAVKGTVAQAEQAFSVAIHRVATATSTVDAPIGSVQVPASLAGIVDGVRGLDTGDQVHSDSQLAPPAFVVDPPCSSYYGEKPATGTPGAFGQPGPFPYAPCGYTPQQVRSAYGLNAAYNAGVDGTGVTVAVIDPYDSPRQEGDTDQYSKNHGLPPVQLTRVASAAATDTPSLPGVNAVVDPDGAVAEETLDIEAIHSMAPGAKIVYEAAESLVGVSLQMAQNDVVNNKRAQIVSNSYGGDGDFKNDMNDSIFMQAAAQGMGFYFSSGDEGDETKDPNGPGDREVDDYANSPYVTAVGGTALGVGKDGERLFESYWGDFTSTLTNGQWPNPGPGPNGTYYAGGGGGTSQSYGEPDYQKGVVPDDFANYWQGKPAEADVDTAVAPGRVVPDISMLGDPNTGMEVGDTQDFSAYANPGSQQLPTDDVHYGEFRIGGTSLSCPLFAGIMALADQAAGKAHGFVNPALYAAYKASPKIVNDITASTVKRAVVRNGYTNQVNADGGTTTVLRDLDDTLTLTSRPGFDDATGMGSPDGVPLLKSLAPQNKALAAIDTTTGFTTTTAGGAPARPIVVPTSSAACPKTALLRYTVHAPKGKRVVAIRVYVAGKLVKTDRGKRLKAVAIRRPAKTTFTVRIQTTLSSGGHVTSRRTYTGCTRTKVVHKAHPKRSRT